MDMKFFDRLFGKGGTEQPEQQVGQLFTDKRMPDMACELNIRGESYLLSELDIRFCGTYLQAYVVIEEDIHPVLEKWIATTQEEDGQLYFYAIEKHVSRGKLFEIDFAGAHCIRYKKVVRANVSALTLTLNFKTIDLNGY